MILTDILLTEVERGVYDITLTDTGDLTADQGYNNSLLISFGTDSRASAAEVPNSQNRRGWWGNLFAPPGDPQLGSKVWLLNTKVKDQANLNLGIAYLQTAYSWLVSSQRASKIEVTGEILTEGYRFEITIFNGTDIIESQTFELWSNTVAS